MNSDKAQPSPSLAKFHKRWKKNRDFLSGRDAVICAGQAYLQKPSARMSDSDYDAFKETVGFFPGALSVLAGWIGLIFRDEPDLIAPDALTNLEQIVTRDGDSLEEFSRAVVRETFITNWTGILDDHPEMPNDPTLNAANALDRGLRPYLAMFPAESILDVEYGVVKNQRAFVYVRLLENAKKVLEYRLVDGVCSVETSNFTDGQWTSHISFPTQNGKTLDFIPFNIVTTNQSKYPTPSAFEHMVDLNCDILNIEGLMAQASRYVANPIVTASNIEPLTNSDGTQVQREWAYGPGIVWEIQGDAKIDVTEIDGSGLTSLQQRLDEKKSQLARTGARILQDDKAAAEAVETVIIRQTSDNARLSGMARVIARQIQNALRTMAWWLGEDRNSVSFELNYDYTEHKFDKEALDILVAADQAGWVSDEIIYHYLTRPGGLIDSAVTFDEWKSQLESKTLSIPSAGLSFQVPTDTTGGNAQ